MDQKMFKQLEKIIQRLLDKAIVNVATKDDLKNFATKDDLKNFATKDDLKNFATKDDLVAMEERLTKEIREAETFAVITADKHKAEKEVVQDLERRVTKIERKLAL